MSDIKFGERLVGIFQILCCRITETKATLLAIEHDDTAEPITEAYRAYTITRKMELKAQLGAMERKLHQVAAVLKDPDGALDDASGLFANVLSLDDFR